MRLKDYVKWEDHFSDEDVIKNHDRQIDQLSDRVGIPALDALREGQHVTLLTILRILIEQRYTLSKNDDVLAAQKAIVRQKITGAWSDHESVIAYTDMRKSDVHTWDTRPDGVLQFEGDWPGYFVRGDDALWMVRSLQDLLHTMESETVQNALSMVTSLRAFSGIQVVKLLIGILSSSHAHSGVIGTKMKAFEDCVKGDQLPPTKQLHPFHIRLGSQDTEADLCAFFGVDTLEKA
jgi:hypothetical protein